MGEPDGGRDGEERRMRVLVCGRDSQIADRVSRVLPGFQLLRVSDNQSALAELRAQPFDLLLTGRETCGKDDVELLHDIRHSNPAVKTRVIIQSDDSSYDDVIAAVRGGAFSYFSKPYFEAAFDEILRHAASGDDWEDSIRVDSATSNWLRIIARCEIPTGDRVIQFMNELSDLVGKERESMGFALKEILMNAMEYGGKFDREQWVEVSYVRGQQMVLYRVHDPGEGFSFAELTHSALSNPPEEPVHHLEVRESMGMRPGGYGVLLSRKLVDDLIYSEQGNDVLLIKYREPTSEEVS